MISIPVERSIPSPNHFFFVEWQDQNFSESLSLPIHLCHFYWKQRKHTSLRVICGRKSRNLFFGRFFMETLYLIFCFDSVLAITYPKKGLALTHPIQKNSFRNETTAFDRRCPRCCDSNG
jgi:hypothetical protein